MNKILASSEASASLPSIEQQTEIRRLWELLILDNLEVLELRAFHYLNSKQIRVEHFRVENYGSIEALQAAFEESALRLNADGFNVYTPLNRLKSDFNGGAAKDSDIRCRDLLLIDIDRVGDTKQPATNDEVLKAMAVADRLSSWLTEKGWPDPIRMLSGNGVHVYCQLDEVENTEQSKLLIRDVLITLGQRFDTPEVATDKSVFNASRITKVPGTIMRKGQASEDRPYRLARLLKALPDGEATAMTKKVTEEMLRAILPVEESCLERPMQEPLVLAALNPFYEQNMVEEVSAALAQISSDVPRGNGSIDLDRCEDYWLGVVWAIAGLDLPEGKEIAREWSAQSSLYTDEGFEKAWDEFDPSHPKPIGIGSVLKLAGALKAQPTEQSFLQKLQGWSSTGDSEVIAKELLEDKFVLKDLALLGQWTTFYASHGVGKTLVTLRLLKESVESGELDGRTVFYVNADDNPRGAVEKLEIVEKLGVEMLLPHRNNFNPDHLVEEMHQAAQKNQARNIVILLDTLKKFVDLMDKRKGTKFGIVARNFVLAGGTIIGLAHTNKHRDDEGKSVYSGTSDIANDCDCVFIIDLISEDKVTGKRTIHFRNEKPRGGVVDQKSFTYVRQKESSYEDLLNSVQVLDEETAKEEKRHEVKKNKYHADKLVIDTIIELARSESLDLTELIKRVSEEAGKSKAHCRTIVDQYKGEALDEYCFWQIQTGAHNRKTLELLTFV